MKDQRNTGLIRAGDGITELFADVLSVEVEHAREAGALGFMARALVQATLPHRRRTGSTFERTNGAFTLTMIAPPKIGLPFGTIPRLLLTWVTTEAVRTKSRELVLGDSLSGFMRELGMVPTGGRWGSIGRLREQCHRLFSSTVSCLYVRPDKRCAGESGFRLADHHILWWDARSPEQGELFDSKVVLSDLFYREVITRPVPIDLRTLRALSKSPMAIDIYVWVTYRMSYLRKPTTIPWAALEAQFGSEYSRTRDFRAAFVHHLRSVVREYPAVRLDVNEGGLLLKPSPTHVPRIGA